MRRPETVCTAVCILCARPGMHTCAHTPVHTDAHKMHTASELQKHTGAHNAHTDLDTSQGMHTHPPVPRTGVVCTAAPALPGLHQTEVHTMLCPDRKSAMTTSNGRTPRYPRNRKPGRCRGCGTYLARGEGCVEIHGPYSWLYC